MWELLITNLLIAVVLYVILKRVFSADPLDKIPGPSYRYIFGNYIEIKNEKPLRPHKRWVKEFPDAKIIRYRFLFGSPRVLITDADIAKTVLVTKQKTFDKNIYSYQKLQEMIGKGLVTMYGEEHAAHRKLAEVAFNYKFLKTMVPIFGRETEKMLTAWRKIPEGGLVNLSQNLANVTLDVIGITGFGFDFAIFDRENPANEIQTPSNHVGEQMYKAVHEMFLQSGIPIAILLPFAKSLPFKEIQVIKKSHQVFEEVIEQIIKNKRSQMATYSEDHEPSDLLEIMISVKDEEGNGLSNIQLVEHCKQFLLAGHETTSTLLSWALYYLHKYPDVREKCVKEVQEVLGSNSWPTAQDLDQLNYLTMTIKEVMRKHPPVPIVFRGSEQEEELEGFIIPKKTQVVISPYLLHRNPKYWDDPKKFCPERFLPENNAKRHPFAYMPFLHGPRNCIGFRFAMLEAKVILSMILREFYFTHDKIQNPFEPKLQVTLRPYPALSMNLHHVK